MYLVGQIAKQDTDEIRIAVFTMYYSVLWLLSYDLVSLG